MGETCSSDGEGRGLYRVLVGKPEGKRDQGLDGMIILRWILRKWDVGLWTGLSWLRIDRWLAIVNAVMNLRVP
jgi:hypothetical protein